MAWLQCESDLMLQVYGLCGPNLGRASAQTEHQVKTFVEVYLLATCIQCLALIGPAICMISSGYTHTGPLIENNVLKHLLSLCYCNIYII